jgi:hypothetical protein
LRKPHRAHYVGSDAAEVKGRNAKAPESYHRESRALRPTAGSASFRLARSYLRADRSATQHRKATAARVGFLDIHFGFASAETEGATAPALLLNGYLDQAGLTDEALYGRRFLFLGFKGSGKSAIGERARLLAEQQSDLFVSVAHLGDFPYATMRRELLSDTSGEASYQTAWAWLLLLRLIGSLQADEHVMGGGDATFTRTITALTRQGILPAKDLRAMVLTSSTRQFKLQLPKIAEYVLAKGYSSPDIALTTLVEHLQSLIINVRSVSRHVLVIDGLDEVLVSEDAQFESLAALLVTAARLNAEFVRCASPTKIVVLCRTDLFERLPGANKNKIRRDWAIELDWYHDPREPRASRLLALADLRASLALGSSGQPMLDRYFYRITRGQDTPKFLLDLTRHTPRDFIALLTSIQRVARATGKYRGGQVSPNEVMSGVRDYSLTYFLPEVRDELDGYLAPVEIDKVIEVIAAGRRRDFTFETLSEICDEVHASDLDLEKAVKTLFECGAVGMAHSLPSGGTQFTFKYRNRNSTVSMRDTFVLHRGLRDALNIL